MAKFKHKDPYHNYIPSREKPKKVGKYSPKKGFYAKDAKCWASHDKEGDIARLTCTLDNGAEVALFLNREDGLVVVDVVDPSGQRGTEIFRKNLAGFFKQSTWLTAGEMDYEGQMNFQR